MSKSPLVAQLETGGDLLISFFGAFDPAIHDRPLTPSEHPGGRAWSAKDHLSHLVQREFDFLPIARRVINREPDPVRLGHRGATPAERAAFVNRENQTVVDERRGESFGELLAQFSALRGELVTLVAALSDAELQGQVELAPGRELPAGDLLSSSHRHATAHVDMVARALSEP